MDSGFAKVVDQRARTLAATIEDAGDFVGANDTDLANALYVASARLREYGKKRLRMNAVPREEE